MTTASLPDVLLRGSAVFIFAIGVFLAAAHAALTALAAPRAALGDRARVALPFAVAVLLAAWLGVGMVLADGTNFPLTRPALQRPLSLVVGFGPMLAAMALLAWSRTIRAVNAAMPPSWLIAVQTYRVAGLMFLYPFLYYGVVPAGFAVPAAVGDFLTGALAPLVALLVARRRPGAFAWATAWNLFGILDLVVAPTAAILTGARVIGIYPLALVPLFIGPPMGILTHVYSLRNLALAARGQAAPSPAPAELPERGRRVRDVVRT